MNIERRLIEIAGEVGGKPTRALANDQIALDERLYLATCSATSTRRWRPCSRRSWTGRTAP